MNYFEYLSDYIHIRVMYVSYYCADAIYRSIIYTITILQSVATLKFTIRIKERSRLDPKIEIGFKANRRIRMQSERSVSTELIYVVS